MNVFTHCYLCFCCTLNLRFRNKFEQKLIAFLKLPVHIVQTKIFALERVITPSLTAQTLVSNTIIECIVIYSSCLTMLVSVMKLMQLAYSNWIYGLLLHPFMVVTSLKWTKLHSSSPFSHGQVAKIFSDKIFKKMKFIRKY